MPSQNQQSLKGIAWAAVVTIIIFAVATIILAPQFSRADSGAIGSAGLLVSCWGLVISVAGFGITLWQLRQTARATQAAADAIAKAKRDYGHFDMVTEARTGQASIAEAQLHITARDWGHAAAACDRARISMVKMTAVKGGLGSQESVVAKDFAAELMSLCDTMTTLGTTVPDLPAIANLVGRLRGMENFVIGIEYGLKDNIRGDQ